MRLMPDTVLVPGMATAIGSLPHRDAAAAAALVLRCLPELPAAPQLPIRTPLEGCRRAMGACDRRCRRWKATARSTLSAPLDANAEIDPTFDVVAHGGLLTFLDVAAALPSPPRQIKVQCAGPLTLGVALRRSRARRRQCVRARRDAVRAPGRRPWKS